MLTNWQVNSTVFGVNQEDFNSLLKNIPFNEKLVLSRPVFIKSYNEAYKDAISVINDESMPSELNSERFTKDQKVYMLKQIIMESGLNLYNEIVSNFVSYERKCSVDEIFSIFKGEIEQPQGFANTCLLAGKKLESYYNDTSKEEYYLNNQIERNKHINRLYGRYIKYCEVNNTYYSREDFLRYVRATDLISQIANPCRERKYEECFYGDLEKALFESIIFSKPIDLVKLQCLRLIQEQDNDGRHRLRISKAIGPEAVITRGGKIRSYEDTSKLVDYLDYFSGEFLKVGIEIRPIILISDDDPRNMYKDSTVISDNDITSIAKDALEYLGNLRSYSRQKGSCVEAYLISHLSSGTQYEEIKSLVKDDCISGGKNVIPITSEKEFSAAVEADQQKYGIPMGYSVSISKEKVGNMFGVFRALHVLAREIMSKRVSNLVYIVKDKPFVANYMAVDLDRDKKNRIPVLLAHSEEGDVFYKNGKF